MRGDRRVGAGIPAVFARDRGLGHGPLRPAALRRPRRVQVGTAVLKLHMNVGPMRRLRHLPPPHTRSCVTQTRQGASAVLHGGLGGLAHLAPRRPVLLRWHPPAPRHHLQVRYFTTSRLVTTCHATLTHTFVLSCGRRGCVFLSGATAVRFRSTTRARSRPSPRRVCGRSLCLPGRWTPPPRHVEAANRVFTPTITPHPSVVVAAGTRKRKGIPHRILNKAPVFTPSSPPCRYWP